MKSSNIRESKWKKEIIGEMNLFRSEMKKVEARGAITQDEESSYLSEGKQFHRPTCLD